MVTVNFLWFKVDTINKKVFAKFETIKPVGFNTFELEVKRQGLVIPSEYKYIELELNKLIFENKSKLKEYCLPKDIKEKWELIEFSTLDCRPSVKVFDRKLEKLYEYQLSDLEGFSSLDSKTKKDLKTLVLHHEDRFKKEVSSCYHSFLDSFRNGYFSTVQSSKGYRRKTVVDTYSR